MLVKKRPVGSGYFAAFWGCAFLLAFLFLFSETIVHWLRGFSNRHIMQAWCLAMSAILLGWGGTRIWTGKQRDYRVGMDTAAFVVAIMAATFAILDLLLHSAAHN